LQQRGPHSALVATVDREETHHAQLSNEAQATLREVEAGYPIHQVGIRSRVRQVIVEFGVLGRDGRQPSSYPGCDERPAGTKKSHMPSEGPGAATGKQRKTAHGHWQHSRPKDQKVRGKRLLLGSNTATTNSAWTREATGTAAKARPWGGPINCSAPTAEAWRRPGRQRRARFAP